MKLQTDYEAAVMQHFLRGVNVADLNKSSSGVTSILHYSVKISV